MKKGSTKVNTTNAVLLITLVILTLGASPHVLAAEKKEQASVSLGKDGKLVYTPDERGNLIPDFSRAGYMGGGVKIPDLPVKVTLEPRAGMKKELAKYDKGSGLKAGKTLESIDLPKFLYPRYDEIGGIAC